MILLLDTSTPTCKLTLISSGDLINDEWQADRTLAANLLPYLEKKLNEQSCTWSDLKGIGVMKGPGSFTGLRIGMTVLNTIADAMHIPIVGVSGDEWQQEALKLLESGENHQIVLPEYGREANITKPRK